MARREAAAKAYTEAMRDAGLDRISASDVARFVQSPFAVWCDRFAPPEERDELDDFDRLLMEQGRAHEEAVVEKAYPDAEPLVYDTREEGFRLVLDSMARGTRAIHGAPVFYLPLGLHGKVDLLERRDDAPSVFGKFHYVVKEIKLAKNLQPHHEIQAAFYNYLLGKVQGYTPPTATLVNRDVDETEFAYVEKSVTEALDSVRAIRAGRRPPAIHGAGVFPWESFTDAEAEKARDVSCVAGIGVSYREKLVAAGITTFDALAAADVRKLTSIKGFGDKRAASFRRNAAALCAGTHTQFAPVTFAEVGTEIFLDLEGTGAQSVSEGLVEMDYLIGALVRTEKKTKYKSFVARTLDGEEQLFRDFVGWLEDQDDYVLYHWHHYEKTHLRRLADRYGLDAEVEPRLFGTLRDLYKDATGSFAFPVHGTSIKKIAPYVGFGWRNPDVGAMTSIVHYFEYVKAPMANAERLRKVLEYNEDDCNAMRAVKDWMVAEGAKFRRAPR